MNGNLGGTLKKNLADFQRYTAALKVIILFIMFSVCACTHAYVCAYVEVHVTDSQGN